MVEPFLETAPAGPLRSLCRCYSSRAMTAHRRPLAWLLFVALLFVQVANAAHACAREASSAADEFIAFSMVDQSSGAMAGCEEMQAAGSDRGLTSSPLCVEHCTHATQATADAHAAVLHWLSAPLLGIFFVLPALDPAFDTLVCSEAPGMGRSIAPAIAILLGRFLS